MKVKPEFCVAVYLSIFLIVGCVTKTSPVFVDPPNEILLPHEIQKGETVIIFFPYITYHDVQTDNELSSESFKVDILSEKMISIAKTNFIQKGLNVLTVNDLPEDKKGNANDILKELKINSPLILAYYKKKEPVLEKLNQLQNVSGASMGYVQHIKVNVGKGGGWDPNSGAMWSGTSSSTAKGVLISLDDGKIIWARELFIRVLPDSNTFFNALEKMYIK